MFAHKDWEGCSARTELGGHPPADRHSSSVFTHHPNVRKTRESKRESWVNRMLIESNSAR
jgi:hypothetical protein